MARKKVTPEEELPQTSLAEELPAQEETADAPMLDEGTVCAETAEETMPESAPDTAEALETEPGANSAEVFAEYAVDTTADPPVPVEVPSAEEAEWGFGEPMQEPELLETQPITVAPSRKSDREQFFGLKFNDLDRALSPEERQEWNSIYASYRGHSALSGRVIGVDPLTDYIWNPKTRQNEKVTMFCAIVVPYRVRILIPESEMWTEGEERPDYVMRNISGSTIDFIITKVDREGGFVVGSRRLASRSQRYFFAHREDLHSTGARVKCRMLAVGPRRCLVECYGHDLNLTQRDIRYAAIPDLRREYHPGMELDCIVKAYDPATDQLSISIKETETNPFFGAEERHPVGSRRLAVISGKYGGGVFCNLPDGVVCMCNYSYQHEDSDFVVGENVMLVVQRYENEKRQMYGKIMSKW